MVFLNYNLFGAYAGFFLDTDEIFASPIMEDAYKVALKLQKIFNIYDRSSEISLLNSQRKIKASPELFELMNKALIYCALSDGEYDISKGKQFLQRKIGGPTLPIHCSYKDIRLKNETITLVNDLVYVDLGSIAKGYITDKIAQFFLDQGIESGYVDARGDIRVFGQGIEIEIQHPRKEELIKSIKVRDKGIATSGDYRQYLGDFSKSHIINKKDVVSATVVADSLADADAMATMLMVCSPEKRDELMARAGFPSMIVDDNLCIRYYNDFERLTDEV